MKEAGYRVTTDNIAAVQTSQVIIVAVTPSQLAGLLASIKDTLDPAKHIVISVISGPRYTIHSVYFKENRILIIATALQI